MGRRKDQAQFNMRLDRTLLKRLQVAAKNQDRSLNSEMVHRLEQSFAQGTVAQLNATARAFLDLAAQQLISEKRPAEASEVLRKLTVEQRMRGKLNETNEERQARWLAMAQDIRIKADANDARGAHDMAARGREWADELERDAGALRDKKPRRAAAAPG